MATETENLDRKAAAEYLTKAGYPIKHSTLAKMASLGNGPDFVLWGRKPLYRPEHLLTWAQARLGQPASSTTAARAQRRA